ncbi:MULTISPECIES: hypothetical protein [unclassified Haloferax]|uniref:hypothetical protein n=1 Tax=unclassified Haloferax TaxID=2625095 RepID=UPI0028751BF3|nr:MULTISPECIES: hypothetical protein [unclassified Haloferax]MDS0243647.1 hypothetical protein [Haloferax sp. S2CR25]MDS0446768.1 hypothetical protein [Haloferax sp. S2CR25-2]
MTEKTDTIEVDPAEVLTKERLVGAVHQLRKLPSPEEFKQTTEAALWEILAPDNRGDKDDVRFEDITSIGQRLIGYTDQSGTELPWWLTQFRWEFDCSGMNSLQIPEDSLEDLEERSTNQTWLNKPEITEEHSVYRSLSGFAELEQKLTERLNLDEVDSNEKPLESDSDEIASDISSSLPDLNDLFEYEAEGMLSTTESFERFIQTLVDIAPPRHETMTALMMVNGGIDQKYLDRTFRSAPDVNDVLMDVLQAASYDRTADRDIRNHFSEIVALEDAFDISVGKKDYPVLGGLEESIYSQFGQQISQMDSSQLEITDKDQDIIYHAKENNSIGKKELPKFVDLFLTSPLSVMGNNRYLSFKTISVRSSYGSTDANDSDREYAIYKLLNGGEESDDA